MTILPAPGTPRGSAIVEIGLVLFVTPKSLQSKQRARCRSILRLVFRDDPAMAHDQHAVACPQIFQFAADHQNRLAVLPHFFDGAEQSFLRLHVDPGGRVHQNQNRGGVGEGAPHDDGVTFAGCRRTGWRPTARRPFGDDPQRVDRRVGRRSAAMRRDEAERPELGAQ